MRCVIDARYIDDNPGSREWLAACFDIKRYPCLELVVADVPLPLIEDLQDRDVRIAPLGRFALGQGAGFIGLTPDTSSWNLNAMKVNQVNYTGAGVTIGLIDTGVDITHPAVKTRVKKWAAAWENGGRIAFLKNVRPLDSSPPERRHGTRVAGVLCGRAFDGHQGVAPDAELSVVRMDYDYQADLSDEGIIEALDYFCSDGVRVVNISIDAATDERPHAIILDAAVRANLLPIVPIGNRGAGNSGLPGRCTSALSVGATEESGAIYPKSGSVFAAGYAVKPDLLAPGSGVYTFAFDPTQYGPIKELDSGTSYAAPHVAGLAALILQKYPTMSSADVRVRILGSCAASPDPSRAALGIPDAVKALQ